MEILLFGQLTDITKTASLQMEFAADTDTLICALQRKFPDLQTATFVVAVNGQIIQQNTILDAGMKVALLPPFSGG